MTYLKGTSRVVSPDHRLFEACRDILYVSDATALALFLLDGADENSNGVLKFLTSVQLRTGMQMGLESKQWPDMAIGIPIYGPFHDGMYNKNPTIEIKFLSHNPIATDPRPHRDSTNLTPGLTFIYTQSFVVMYERYLRFLKSKFTAETKNWPDLFRFCRVVRNGIVHKHGLVDFENKNAKPVHWYNLTYSYDDRENRRMVGGHSADLALADLLILMFEFSDKLDELGCPVL